MLWRLWLLVGSDRQTNQGTMSPIELLWTAKKTPVVKLLLCFCDSFIVLTFKKCVKPSLQGGGGCAPTCSLRVHHSSLRPQNVSVWKMTNIKYVSIVSIVKHPSPPKSSIQNLWYLTQTPRSGSKERDDNCKHAPLQRGGICNSAFKPCGYFFALSYLKCSLVILEPKIQILPHRWSVFYESLPEILRTI